MARAQFDWNESSVSALRQHWASGLSGSEIAIRLGGGLTRNAIIGKAHRLGLSGRIPSRSDGGVRIRYPKKPRQGRKPRNRLGLSVIPKRPIRAPIIPKNEPPSLGIALVDLKPNACRWLHADGSFCGQPKAAKGSYCEYHAQFVYRK